jgi:hypothetical protein
MLADDEDTRLPRSADFFPDPTRGFGTLLVAWMWGLYFTVLLLIRVAFVLNKGRGKQQQHPIATVYAKYHKDHRRPEEEIFAEAAPGFGNSEDGRVVSMLNPKNEASDELSDQDKQFLEHFVDAFAREESAPTGDELKLQRIAHLAARITSTMKHIEPSGELTAPIVAFLLDPCSYLGYLQLSATFCTWILTTRILGRPAPQAHPALPLRRQEELRPEPPHPRRPHSGLLLLVVWAVVFH